MKTVLLFLFLSGLIAVLSCGQTSQEAEPQGESQEFQYQTEQFADIRILRYQVPGFEELDRQKKELLYYLYEAALSGRDIIWDQNYRHNLLVRRTLENIVRTYSGDRDTDHWDQFLTYVKRVWFSNGIHHHYSSLKIKPEFPQHYFAHLVENSDPAAFPLEEASSEFETVDQLTAFLTPVLFDPQVAPKKVNLDSSVDQVQTSAVNFYGPNVRQADVEAYYATKQSPDPSRPLAFGLNSQVVNVDGETHERVWKVGGMYSPAIERIVYWLEKAVAVAETSTQKAALEKLIEYYRTGNLQVWDEYNVVWVKDTDSSVDFINGFIEVYNDPLGLKGSFESVVSFRDKEATRRIEALSRHAQWFEENSPILDQHKKEDVQGISARVITVVAEAGDTSPSTPIGINLPNSSWIRAEHGSKSVNLGNIVYAYDESSRQSGVLEEFAYSEEEIRRSREYGTLGDNLHTDMHEVIGHASGRLEPGTGIPAETLRSYASTLEETRADLVALYFQMDPKLVEIGVMPSLDVGKAGYDGYIRNGLMVQLARLNPGEELEEAHMRNRQLISRWVYEKGKAENVIERKTRDGQTYFVINNYEHLRKLFGELLREVQRIKSTGDYDAARDLVESYGVKVDHELHEEILERYRKLNRAPYAGFINPVLTAVQDENDRIVDVHVDYPDDFQQQMLYYADHYSTLPVVN